MTSYSGCLPALPSLQVGKESPDTVFQKGVSLLRTKSRGNVGTSHIGAVSHTSAFPREVPSLTLQQFVKECDVPPPHPSSWFTCS